MSSKWPILFYEKKNTWPEKKYYEKCKILNLKNLNSFSFCWIEIIGVEKNDNTTIRVETDPKTPKWKDPRDVDSPETNNEWVNQDKKRKSKFIVWNHYIKKKKW